MPSKYLLAAWDTNGCLRNGLFLWRLDLQEDLETLKSTNKKLEQQVKAQKDCWETELLQWVWFLEGRIYYVTDPLGQGQIRSPEFFSKESSIMAVIGVILGWRISIWMVKQSNLSLSINVKCCIRAVWGQEAKIVLKKSGFWTHSVPIGSRPNGFWTNSKP